jgi:hypothetical protein
LERLKQQLNAAVAEIEAHQQQTARLKTIEDATREHCKAYPVIAFDGAAFVDKTGAVPQQLVLEDALSSSEHEAKRMSAENQSLKSEIARLDKAHISEFRELRRSLDTSTARSSIPTVLNISCELAALRAELDGAVRARADLEQQLSHLRDDNRRLHAANLASNAREANILRRCEEQLSKVTGIPVDSAARLELPPLDVGAVVSESNDILRRRNEVLEDENRVLAQRIDTLSREAAAAADTIARLRRHEEDAERWREKVEEMLQRAAEDDQRRVGQVETELLMTRQQIGRLKGRNEELLKVLSAKDIEIHRWKHAARQERLRGIVVEEPEHHDEPEIDPPSFDETRAS